MLPGAPRTTHGSLFSSNNSISHATDALAGTFTQVRQRQPRVAEHSRSQPDAPNRASPLPACPRVRRRAGSSAQYPPHQNSRQSSRKRHREDGVRKGEWQTGSALHQLSRTAGGHEQRWSHPLPALTHLLLVPAVSSLRPWRTRGSAKSP